MQREVRAVGADFDEAQFQKRVTETVLENGKVRAGAVADPVREGQRDLPAISQAHDIEGVPFRVTQC